MSDEDGHLVHKHEKREEEEDEEELCTLCTTYRGHCDNDGLRAPADAQFLMTRGSMMCIDRESNQSNRIMSRIGSF